MAAKRTASSELNHDNWDDDCEPEDAGNFKRAPEDVIQKRVIKTAKRRNPLSSTDEGSKSATNVFSNFGGFKKPVQETASPFAFLSKMTSPSNKNGLSSTSVASATISNSNTLFKLPESTSNTTNKIETEKNSTYYTKLQGLNESVSEWIKTHVDKNPFCILTPIFKDYEKHLEELEKLKEESKVEKKTMDSTVLSSKQNLFTSETKETKETNATTAAPTIFGNNTFSFGNSAPFSFPNVAKPETNEKKDDETNEDEDEPPKVELTQVVEDGSVYSIRCKVFVKKDDSFANRGVGKLFLKPVEGNKTQLIVRQETSTGNLLLNLILSKSVPTQRMGENNVMMVCVPDEKAKPPPVPVLLRVKTAVEADELLSTLEKHKN